ncbi:DNA-binding transcriptional regulator KdgR [Rhizobium sp. SSA_523]|uniref:DNA-binding transcriptional regulator KdgR n=1 Tax=Rhizobium sp. SSA_523 TaxID=2952477 RepID=UPI002091200F|nr:DNA-binding transcriptional regulator KdgR [Rhizobium sp. SSA_523]MCO5732202.1 DNA-binding transcriptional regulator KdgR [Rhizobium sp. SSA_523]WKC21384.1 DNA-binding transcriptional regulator KdgR [Rhizobium sp. SSA_523]
MADTQVKTDNVAAVLKVFAVLEALVDEKRVSLADLAQRAMTSKTTAHRLLQTMMELGYVEQDQDTEKYGLTLKLFSLGARSLSEQADLLRVADQSMGRLSRATGESINLGILDERDEKVVYIHKYDSAFNLSMKSTLGLRNPLHSTSLGKALLAWRDDDEIRDRMARMEFTKHAPRTLTDPDALMADLKAARARGVAEEIEESEAGVRCLAAPVFNHMGKPVAAISISFPLFRFDEGRRQDYIDLLTEAGLSASIALGYRPAH